MREKEYLTEDAVAQCDGTMFRECDAPGNNRSDMCYNQRMMAISCSSDISPLEMRKRQITKKIGDPCDPVSETWLGCQAAK